MKKILLLIGCIFLFTGCKVEYNLVINNDLTVSEEVSMTGTDEFFDSYYKSSRINILNMVFDDSRKEELKKLGYNYEIVEGTTPYVLAKKKYNNISDFANNTIFSSQYFENLEVVDENGIISLKSKDFIPMNPDSLERYEIKTTTISIKLAYEVLEHNAKEVDKKTNTYTWYIDDETEEFSINLSYDTNNIYEVPKDNTNLIMILVTILIIIVVIVVAYYLNKKNNR